MMRSTKLARLVPALALVGLLAACQTLGSDRLIASVAPSEMPQPVAEAIAADLVEQFGKDVGPATGTIVLPADGSPFRAALEASLRAKGYAIGPGGEGRAVPIAFVVDRADGEVMARLSTETLDLTRTYRETATGAQPSSPVSINRRDRGDG